MLASVFAAGRKRVWSRRWKTARRPQTTTTVCVTGDAGSSDECVVELLQEQSCRCRRG